MKNKLLASLATLVITTGILGSATFAWFTASDEVNANTITTGNAQIIAYRDNGDSVPPSEPMFYLGNEGLFPVGSLPGDAYPVAKWFPGQQATRTMVVKNTGNLSLRADWFAFNVRGISGQEKEDFLDNMKVTIKDAGTGTVILYDNVSLRTLYENCTTPVRLDSSKRLATLMHQNGTVNFLITVKMDGNAGNSLMNQAPIIDINVHAQDRKSVV